MKKKEIQRLLAVGVAAVSGLFAHISPAATLSGLVEFSTDANGNFFNGSVWNTRGGDSAVNLWVIKGTNLHGVFINGPSDAQAGISVPMTEGEHTFVLYGNQGGSTPHHGLNLFFNGNNTAPRISVFGRTQISPDAPHPSFAANDGNTLTLAFGSAPGANTLVFEDATARIELTDYRFADFSVYDTDRVSQRSVFPDGGADFIGQFTLRVTNVRPPDPDPNRTVFDVSRDFSTSSNPGGAWSYGYVSTLGGPFSIYNFGQFGFGDNPVRIFNWSKNGFEPGAVYFNPSSETSIGNNGNGVFPPGTVYFFPGDHGRPDNFAVIRLTVPADGRYRIDSSVRSHLQGDASGDTDFHILKNSSEIFGQFLPPRSGTGYSNELVLAGGDTIDFAVCRGQDGILEGSGLIIQARLERITNGSATSVTLSGLVEFSTDADGNFFNGSVWNTRGSDTAVNLWVIEGADRQGSFINGPSDAQAGISVPLSEGDHTFTIYGNQGGPTPHHGLNLFFNGSNATPRISVFGPTQTSADPPFPAFSANSSPSTLTLAFQPVAGANTLVFQEGDTRVELTGYRWANFSVYNTDRVSQGIITPDGTADFVGQFTLRVTKVPVLPVPPTLTGLIEFSTDAAGNFFNGSVWNTRGGDTAVNLWVAKGTDLQAPFINGPTDAQAGISILLEPGVNDFVIYGNQGGPTPHHGLNFFFNGNNSIPGISVFGSTQTSQNPPYPPFSPNGSPSTLTLAFSPVPGANTLVFRDGDIRVELTDYRWANPFVYNVDRVSQPVAVPDGGADFIGRFTLVVTRQSSSDAPTAHIALSPQITIGGAPHPFVIACDGREAVVTLDGRGSSDPNNEPLSFAWFPTGSQTPFSTASTPNVRAAVGLHSVTLVVSDAQSSDSAVQVFEVITPAEAAAQISLLLDAADLPRKHKHPLQASLRNAIDSLERGKIQAAIGQLGAFKNKVRVQIGSSHPTLAASLLGATDALIAALEDCDEGGGHDEDDDDGNGRRDDD